MFLTSACRSTVKCASVFFFVLHFLSITPTTIAQIGTTAIDNDPSSGMRRGTNTIVGQVFSPSGQQLDRRITVRLSSVHVGEFSTMTDTNGVFTFRRLREGSYFITVQAGNDYLPTNETVEFYDNRGRTNTMQIQLRSKPIVNKAGVVNAALSGVPRPALELYNQALISARANDSKMAIEQFKAAVALYPAFVLALNELSIVYLGLGDLENAAAALHQATKNAPANFSLRLNLGYVLMQMKKFAEAEAELHKATELSNSSQIAHLYRGRALVSLQKYGEAEKELRRVIALGGVHVPMAYRYLGALFNETGDKPRAIEFLEKYLALEPKADDTNELRKIITELKTGLQKPESQKEDNGSPQP